MAANAGYVGAVVYHRIPIIAGKSQAMQFPSWVIPVTHPTRPTEVQQSLSCASFSEALKCMFVLAGTRHVPVFYQALRSMAGLVESCQ